MIVEFFTGIFLFFLSSLPSIAVPPALVHAIGWLTSVVGYVNIFVPVAGVAPILGMIIAIRNWNIILSIFKFVFRFVPFIDGGN